MAKKKRGTKLASSGKKARKEDKPNSPPSGKKHDKESSILEAVEAMSSSDEEPIGQTNKTSNAKAEALKKLIKAGSFNTLLEKDHKDEDDDSIEEVVLDDDDDIEDNGQSENADEEDSKGAKLADADDRKTDQQMDDEDEEGNESKDSNNSEEDDDENENATEQGVFDTNSKALLAKTAQLQAEKKHFPWVERFDVVPSVPLPFGEVDEGTGKKIDVHDDLSREVAFYDIALEAVRLARAECKKAGVPFARPDDFFAEMVKSDDHMARVKDRLIFENKKIEAVAQRKSNKEQKLRSKEANSNKVAEKSRRKKENMNFVDDWAKTAASNRGGKYGDQDDQKFLRKMSSSPDKGPNKKRQAADKKYGFGGKTGRFKQADPKAINDMSGFNPKGNFSGGTKRQGKRARDAGRKRQRTS